MAEEDQKSFELTRQQLRLADAAVAIRAEEPGPEDTAFLTRYMVQATLPHRSPKGNPPEWFRVNGDYTLSIRPGYTTDPKTRERVCVGYPFGSVPRLLMFWLTTEALRTGNRKLELGKSLSGFMRELGLNPDNGSVKSARSDARRLHDQMERLFRATISFEYSTLEVRRWKDMQVAPEGELWWDLKRPNQSVLWDSWVELGEKFYEAIIASPVPVDMRALRELKNSPLALDLYAWTTYKTFILSQQKKSQRISWHQLRAQLGTDYKDPKDFRHYAKDALRKVALVYPGLRLDEVTGGVIIHPGRPAIPSKPKASKSAVRG